MHGAYRGEPREDNVFVVGCQRSGTSAVYAGLIAHPELKPLRPFDRASGYDPKELYYFRNLFGARRQMPSPMYGWDVDREYLQRMVDLTVRFCAEHHGAANGRWVNAHPMNALDLPEILETMPGSRIVYVLRHPQEVVWSMIHAPWVDDRGAAPAADVRRQAAHWGRFAAVAQEIESGAYGSSVLLVRHAELVADTARVSRDLLSHLGLPQRPEVLAQLAGPTFNSSFQDGAKPIDLVEETRRQIAADARFCGLVQREVGEPMAALGFRDLAGEEGSRTGWLARVGRTRGRRGSG